MNETTGKQPEIGPSPLQATLENIRNRISRDTISRNLLGIKAEGIEDIETRFGVQFPPGIDRSTVESVSGQPTKIAQSEVVISVDRVNEIKEKAELVREWVLNHGREFVPDEVETRREYGNPIVGRIYEEERPGGKGSKDDKYYVVADENATLSGADLVGDYLFFEESSRRLGADMMTKIGFDDTYSLEIGFTTSDRSKIIEAQERVSRALGIDLPEVDSVFEHKYHSGERSIKAMSDADALIISTTLDNFIKAKGISLQKTDVPQGIGDSLGDVNLNPETE